MATPRLGINLSYVADFATELPFVDLMRQARPWISQQAGKPWGQGPALDLNPNGWPRSLGPDCYAESPLAYDIDGRYPAGVYTLSFDGRGTVVLHCGGRPLVEATTSPQTITVDPQAGNLGLRIMATDPVYPVQNIRLMMPGHSPDYYPAIPWSPAFLDRWRGVAAIRFMDMQMTNGSAVVDWSDRTRVEDYTWAKEFGAPVEVMVDLANRLRTNPWACFPHQATDDYATRFFEYVRDHLDPSLVLYFEYSNETWNGGFAQHAYAANKGLELGMATKEWEAAWRYTAVRSVELFKIAESVFGGTSRLRRVLPSQAGNPFVSEVICDHVVDGRSAHEYADALAIAPYFAFNVGTAATDDTPDAATVAGWSVSQVLDHLATVSLPNAAEAIRGQAEVAKARGLELVAYEGGQHCVGIGSAANNDALTNLFIAANADPGMGDLYAAHLSTWASHGGGLYCAYNSTMKPSRFGAWGAYAYSDRDSAKGRALVSWAASVGQAIGGEAPPVDPPPVPPPTPPPPPPPVDPPPVPDAGMLPKARAFRVKVAPSATPRTMRVDVARDGKVTADWVQS